MTDLMVQTGELPAAAMDHDSAVRLDKRIRLMAATVRENLAKIADLVEEAKTGQAHIALGFASWPAYLADALGGQLELDTASRREVVALMSGEGMSQRAIAQAVGVSQMTVSRDQSAIADEVKHDVSPEPDPVADEDGEEQPADPAMVAQLVDELLAIAADVEVIEDEGSPGPQPEAEAIDRDGIDELVDWQLGKRRIGAASRALGGPRAPRRDLPAVTGLDGKNYSRPEPQPAKPPRRGPLTHDAVRAAIELDRVLKRVRKVLDDDRFGANRDAIVRQFRPYVPAGLELLNRLADADQSVIDAEVIEAVAE